MKWLTYLLCALFISGCAARATEEKESATAGAQVGIVNHTGKYIYSASVDGAGGGNMDRWGAGMANICCATIPRVWHPGMKVLVRWNMPEGRTDVIKEKTVVIEKYDRPGSVYMHFFPDDEVRVVVSGVGPRNHEHPIRHSGKPANAPSQN